VNAYVDSSVFLRILFGQKPQIVDFQRIETTVSSVLLFIEGRRVVDRVRLETAARKTIGSPHERFLAAVERIQFVEFDSNIVSLAAQPLRYVLKTLDAIHLATALDWRRRHNKDLIFLTHDTQLATAARHVGFSVLGR